MKQNTSAFEDRFAGIVAVLSGLVFIFLALAGPLVFNLIRYRTSASAVFQGQGQDLFNLVLMAPVCVIGGILALRRSPNAARWIAFLPVYLMYSALAFGVGIEWSDPRYTGNSERFAFFFVFEMIAGLVLLLHCLGSLRDREVPEIRKRGKTIYSIIFVVLMAAFAFMWGSSLLEVALTGGTAGYADAPTGFWTIRILDLGVSIPLGLLSVYLLWTRPKAGFPIQLLFYGFFIAQITAVLAMIVVEIANGDPLVNPVMVVIFGCIAAAVYGGYVFITKRRNA
jgi:hypothetical protein